MVHAQAVGPEAAATIPCTDLTFTAYTKGGSGYEDEQPLTEQRRSNVRHAIPVRRSAPVPPSAQNRFTGRSCSLSGCAVQNFDGLRELGVGLVVLEGEVEAKELWERVKAQCVDVTEPVADFVAGASGEPFVGPFSNLPAVFLYVPKPGNMLLFVTSLSCGSAVMAPHVLQSKRLTVHNAWTLHCGANLLASFLRPEKPLVPIAESAFGDLLGSNAARALMAKAKELGASYLTPSQLGGRNSQEVANEVYEAALYILGWKALGRRLGGYSDDEIALLHPQIVAALLHERHAAAGKTPSSRIYMHMHMDCVSIAIYLSI
jgi:hypothetical protein